MVNCVKNWYSCIKGCIKEDVTTDDLARKVVENEKNPKTELDFRILRHLQKYEYDSICQIKKDEKGVFQSLVGRVVMAHDQSAFDDLISAVGVRVLGNEAKSEEFNQMFLKHLPKRAGLDPLFNEIALTIILLEGSYTFEQNSLSQFMNEYEIKNIEEFYEKFRPSAQSTYYLYGLILFCFASILTAPKFRYF